MNTYVRRTKPYLAPLLRKQSSAAIAWRPCGSRASHSVARHDLCELTSQRYRSLGSSSRTSVELIHALAITCLNLTCQFACLLGPIPRIRWAFWNFAFFLWHYRIHCVAPWRILALIWVSAVVMVAKTVSPLAFCVQGRLDLG